MLTVLDSIAQARAPRWALAEGELEMLEGPTADYLATLAPARDLGPGWVCALAWAGYALPRVMPTAPEPESEASERPPSPDDRWYPSTTRVAPPPRVPPEPMPSEADLEGS